LRISFALQCSAVSATLWLTGCGSADLAGIGSGSPGSSSGGASSTGGGTTTGAPPACSPCTPANICDNGCTQADGSCLDQLTANNAQTGTPCDAGSVCEGTLCYTGSGPQLPDNGGGVLAQPNVVLMTFDSDPNQAALEQWGVWFMDGGILETTLSQYGVQNGTIQFVRLKDSMPDPNSFPTYLENHFASDSTMPANAPNNIYLISMPSSWQYSASFCKSMGGYHTVLYDQSRSYPVYAVIANCTDDLEGNVEVSSSHEIAEAATDPYSGSWTFLSSSSPWAFSGGGEVGDLCESNSTHYLTSNGRYASQYLWSNNAARLGQVPCQPWPLDEVYIQTLGPETVQSVPPGETANIPITGWASGPIAQWAVVAEEPISGVDFQTYPTTSSQTVSPGEQIMAQLNIPPATEGQPAVGGLLGGAWIFNATDDTHLYGSTMVGVQISCQTSADCANPAYSCASGVCGYNYCESSAKAFSRCTASQGTDGVCLPFDGANGTTVEVCSQAGSLAAGTRACGPSRIVGGGASSYCDSTSICEGSTSPACFSLCVPSNGCPGDKVCYPLGNSYGFCVDQCNPPVCPAGQGCYNAGSADICYPN